MTKEPDGISRRHALRLFLGQGEEIRRERDKLHLELDQESAMTLMHLEPPPAPVENAPPDPSEPESGSA